MNQLLPPQSEEAELAVLGSILIDPPAYYDIADTLAADDFASTFRGQVYGVMASLLGNGRSVDFLTLGEVMKAKNITPPKENIDAFIIGLMNAVPTSVQIESYAAIVKAHATRRRLINAASTVATLAYDENEPITAVVEQSESALLQATESLAVRDMRPINASLSAIYDTTAERREAGGKVGGLLTGFTDLDRILRGINDDDLVILAARPGMGKSALAGQIAINVATSGKRVLIFNLEMSEEQITYRMVAALSKLPLTKIIEGRLPHDDDWQRFGNAVGRLGQLPIAIDDTPSLTPTQMRAKARRQAGRGEIGLIIVDYLQLMDGDGRHQNDNARVAYISRQLKRLAKEVAPVLALAQLSRSVEGRQDKRPLLSDLRDSGAIEQDADRVAFIYRDDYYKEEASEWPNQAEIIVAKNRHGETGMARLFFNKQAVTFANLENRSVNL